MHFFAWGHAFFCTGVCIFLHGKGAFFCIPKARKKANIRTDVCLISFLHPSYKHPTTSLSSHTKNSRCFNIYTYVYILNTTILDRITLTISSEEFFWQNFINLLCIKVCPVRNTPKMKEIRLVPFIEVYYLPIY